MARQPLVRSRERGAGVLANAGQSERSQRKAARRAALGPLVPAAFGRSTRGSESDVATLAAKRNRCA